jgi:adenylylsulfate kinase-like enzyme
MLPDAVRYERENLSATGCTLLHGINARRLKINLEHQKEDRRPNVRKIGNLRPIIMHFQL